MSQNWIAGSLCLLHISLRKKRSTMQYAQIFWPLFLPFTAPPLIFIANSAAQSYKMRQFVGFWIQLSSYFITAIIFVTSDGKRSNICSYKESSYLKFSLTSKTYTEIFFNPLVKGLQLAFCQIYFGWLILILDQAYVQTSLLLHWFSQFWPFFPSSPSFVVWLHGETETNLVS